PWSLGAPPLVLLLADQAERGRVARAEDCVNELVVAQPAERRFAVGENRAHLLHADAIERAVRQTQVAARRLDECGFDFLTRPARKRCARRDEAGQLL